MISSWLLTTTFSKVASLLTGAVKRMVYSSVSPFSDVTVMVAVEVASSKTVVTVWSEEAGTG